MADHAIGNDEKRSFFLLYSSGWLVKKFCFSCFVIGKNTRKQFRNYQSLVMKRTSLFLIVFVSLCHLATRASIYYVAPTGSDANPGSIDFPFRTVQRAQTSVVAGDTVYIRGGTYVMQESDIAATTTASGVQFAYVTNLTKSGTAGKRINYWAYPGERPVFDYTNIKPANTRVNAFEVSGAWLHIKGLEVVGVQVTITNVNTQSICFSQSGAGGNNIYEQLSMHDGQAIGFYLTRGPNNLILNCDAYRNYDYTSQAGGGVNGGNVDGFGCHPNNANYTGNVFRGCRAWYNSDDGYDCISAFAATTFENCWAWRNGYSTTGASLGDGNGFKAGGYGTSTSPSVPAVIPRNTIRFCVAVYNKANGFYANHHPGGSDWYNNTAYRNSVNFNMLNRSPDYQSDVPGYGHAIRNNTSYSARSSNADIQNYNAAQCTIDHNSFLNGMTVSPADFVSLDTALLSVARRADGSLPLTDLLRLTSSSQMIDAGMDVGFPYYGTAPDLGAFEYTPFALAVEMLSFSASVINHSVVLNWSVASESQNKGWAIERLSPNSNVRETIGFVNGRGSSNESAAYRFTDKGVGKGTYQYRLKQINFDGSSNYSSVRSVDVGEANAVALEVYPVPVVAGSTARYTLPDKAKVTIRLFNAAGQFMATLIDKESDAGQYRLVLPDELFPTKGVYVLRLTVAKSEVAKSIIK